MLKKLLSLGIPGLAFLSVGCDFGGLVPHSVGGIVSDLAGTLSLKINNGEPPLTITRSGHFEFKKLLSNGKSYAISIHRQPENQICKLYNATGSVAGSDVDNVTVRCFGPSIYEVGGKVSGLTGGTLTLGLYAHSELQLPEEHLEITHDGAYKFKTKLPGQTPYHIFVTERPKGQICGSAGPTSKERVVASTINDEDFRCEKATASASASL